MRYYVFATAVAGALALASPAPAQSVTPQDPRPTVPSVEGAKRQRQATIEGCLMREADVAGQKPVVADEVGSGATDDYILTGARVVKGPQPPAGGIAGMFDVDGLDGERLSGLVGKRVQVIGLIEKAPREGVARENAADADELLEVQGSSIVAVAGECPAGKRR